MVEPEGNLRITQVNDVYLVEFAERKILEELSIVKIGEQLTTLVSETPSIKMLLNFGSVEHMSSAALGMLINLDKKVKTISGQLKLCNIKPQIYEIFKITRLDAYFDIYETVDRALRTF